MNLVSIILGVVLAGLLHAGFLLFGGLIVPHAKADQSVTREVDLVTDMEDQKKEEKPPEPQPEEVKAEEEKPPDASEVIKNLEQPVSNEAPALDAASLAAIEAALNGAGGGGDFASAVDLTGGGVIGGKGKAGSLDQQLENAFSLSEIDQKPRAVFQTTPVYPSEMRGKKVEGVVAVLFVVDAAGKVANPRVETSSNTAFNKPALDAVKRWKFEPAVKAGERVACKMRVPIRFQPS